MTTVVNRALGLKPSVSTAERRFARGGRSRKSQYGQTLSSVLMNARQFGHIRRFSTDCHCTKSRATLNLRQCHALITVERFLRRVFQTDRALLQSCPTCNRDLQHVLETTDECGA